MRNVLMGLGLVVAVAGGGVAVAQHAPRHHDAAKATHHQMALQMCAHGDGSAEALNEHISLMATELNLTAEQRATVTRIATEACAAMAKYHDEIHSTLTPEQRGKLKELHGGDGSGLHALFKKLHGGR